MTVVKLFACNPRDRFNMLPRAAKVNIGWNFMTNTPAMTKEINFTPNVRCRMAAIVELDVRYDPLETSMLGNVVEKRRREFHAGRHIARSLIAETGFVPVSIPIDNRLPRWPPGLCGSITHSATHVAAAVAPTWAFRGVGLDIETSDAVDPSLYRLVLLDSEREMVTQRGIDPTIYFSCKEAVYKAVFPRFHEDFEFTDITIGLHGSGFVATPATRHLDSRPAIVGGIGHFEMFERHVVTLFILPNRTR